MYVFAQILNSEHIGAQTSISQHLFSMFRLYTQLKGSFYQNLLALFGNSFSIPSLSTLNTKVPGIPTFDLVAISIMASVRDSGNWKYTFPSPALKPTCKIIIDCLYYLMSSGSSRIWLKGEGSFIALFWWPSCFLNMNLLK